MIIMAKKKKSNKNNEHKPALGSGERFRRLKAKLATRATTPGALAAWIGRKKYGKKKMAKLSAEGRKRK